MNRVTMPGGMFNLTHCCEMARILGGVPILGAVPGSPAARAGLRVGDVLLSVNGKPTATIDDFLAARDDRGDTLTARVFRHGAELDLVLDMRDA